MDMITRAERYVGHSDTHLKLFQLGIRGNTGKDAILSSLKVRIVAAKGTESVRNCHQATRPVTAYLLLLTSTTTLEVFEVYSSPIFRLRTLFLVSPVHYMLQTIRPKLSDIPAD